MELSEEKKSSSLPQSSMLVSLVRKVSNKKIIFHLDTKIGKVGNLGFICTCIRAHRDRPESPMAKKDGRVGH